MANWQLYLIAYSLVPPHITIFGGYLSLRHKHTLLISFIIPLDFPIVPEASVETI